MGRKSLLFWCVFFDQKKGKEDQGTHQVHVDRHVVGWGGGGGKFRHGLLEKSLTLVTADKDQIARNLHFGSSQTWLFQTWLFAIFTQERSFALVAPFYALLHFFADLRLRSFVLICAHFCVRPRLERPRLEIADHFKVAQKVAARLGESSRGNMIRGNRTESL